MIIGKAHYKSTGPEIWRGYQGEITHFVSSMAVPLENYNGYFYLLSEKGSN